MDINPPPISQGWGDATSGPIPVWALWFQNVWENLPKDESGNLVISAGSGSITSYTATYQFTKTGSVVSLIFQITITNAGTGAGDINVTIPHTASSLISGSAREMDVVGFQCSCSGAAGTTFGVRKYDNTTIIATGHRIVGQVSYFV